jgi:signal recognition particle receptor subunit beta
MSLFNSIFDSVNKIFIKENDNGNIEYKWRLDYKTDMSIKKLVSQMLWRLNEGKEIYGIYEAHYLLGVYDNGNLGELTKEQLDTNIDIFYKIINKANAEVVHNEYHLINGSNIYYCIIRTQASNKKINEINIIVCGSEQVGKTTFISYLCNSNIDDGNGLIREYIMNHEHEKISGNTTSIRKQIIGIKNNSILNYDFSNNWEEITNLSDKIINIYDTPGNKKYFKTVLNSLRSLSIDMIFYIDDKKDDKKDDKSDYEKLLKNYADIFKIKFYRLNSKTMINSSDNNLNISCINPEKSDMSKLFDILIKYNKLEVNNSDILKQFNIFKITAIYNIPERNKIIEGVQSSGLLKLNINKKHYILYSDLSYDEIFIKSIFRKNIESKQLYKNETGSISYDLIKLNTQINRCINKNCIIIDSLDYLDDIKIFEKNSIIKLKILINGENNNKLNYILVNGNLSYFVNLIKAEDAEDVEDIKYIYIKLNSKIYLQDDVIFLLPVDFKSFSEVYLTVNSNKN